MAKLHHSKVENKAHNSKSPKTRIDTRDIFDKALESPHSDEESLGGSGGVRARVIDVHQKGSLNKMSKGRPVGRRYTKGD